MVIGISVVVVLLLIVIIVLMVIGLLRKKGRKNDWSVPNNATYPNPMYYNYQSKLTITKTGTKNQHTTLLINLLLVSVKGDHDNNMQNVVDSMGYKAVLDNTQATGPDYDEIKDEPSTEKPSERLQEEKSVELTKSSNNYFTLMPPEDQENISNVMS